MLGSAKTNLPLLTLTSWVKGTSPLLRKSEQKIARVSGLGSCPTWWEIKMRDSLHWCLAPLISRIYKTHWAGSKLSWVNSAAHKFELKLFVSNVPLALLIDPWKFKVDALKGRKVPLEKPNHIWAIPGQNRPKSAGRIMQSLRARLHRRARGLIFRHLIRIEISWGSAQKSSRSNQPLPSYLLKTIAPL